MLLHTFMKRNKLKKCKKRRARERIVIYLRGMSQPYKSLAKGSTGQADDRVLLEKHRHRFLQSNVIFVNYKHKTLYFQPNVIHTNTRIFAKFQENIPWFFLGAISKYRYSD